MNEIDLLEQKLRRLRLSGIAQNLSVRLHSAQVADLTYQEFLDQLMTDEIDRRSSNLFQKRIKKAQFLYRH